MRACEVQSAPSKRHIAPNALRHRHRHRHRPRPRPRPRPSPSASACASGATHPPLGPLESDLSYKNIIMETHFLIKSFHFLSSFHVRSISISYLYPCGMNLSFHFIQSEVFPFSYFIFSIICFEKFGNVTFSPPWNKSRPRDS